MYYGNLSLAQKQNFKWAAGGNIMIPLGPILINNTTVWGFNAVLGAQTGYHIGNPFGYRSRHIRFTTRKRIGKHIGLRIGKRIGLRIGKQIGLRIGVEKSFINYDNK